MYKIRNITTGKFSTGGKRPDFTSGGKMFLSLANIKRHFQVINSGRLYSHLDTYKNCEIVEYETKEINTHIIEELTCHNQLLTTS